MKRALLLSVACSLIFSACNSEPTLQKYFVANTEDKDFIAVDVSPSILNIDSKKLTADQKLALKSFDKMNILAFKVNDQNKAKFEAECAKVKTILKDEKYQELMKFGSGKESASVSFVGDDEHIDEFILFANQKEKGFAVVRILGEDMNPTGVMSMLSILKTSNMDMEQLKPLQALLAQ
jgi:uncharacterized protein DUF4252